MSIYEVTSTEIRPIERTTFRDAQIQERTDLQRLLRQRIEIIAPGCMVLAEEFGDWDDSRRRIDLLAIDSDANLVVIELKRTEDGGHMELQAVRYAAMVSTMTFEQACRTHEKFLVAVGRGGEDAAANILEFLGWDEPNDELFAQDVRIVLASAQFARELTSAVMWLNERGLDIRCVRLIPYADGDRVLLDVQQVIPLPEAEASVKFTPRSPFASSGPGTGSLSHCPRYRGAMASSRRMHRALRGTDRAGRPGSSPRVRRGHW